jgi:hypothetical protein
MKMVSKPCLSLVIAALAFLLFPNPASAADYGQLTVKRSANFGANLGVDVWVDRKRVRRLHYGQTYTSSLPPGIHEVRASLTARRESNTPVTRLTVESGKHYQLTVGWHGQNLVLR